MTPGWNHDNSVAALAHRRLRLFLLGLFVLGGAGCLIEQHSSDPQMRIEQLLPQTEEQKAIKQEWERIWFTDQPSKLTPNVVHGGFTQPERFTQPEPTPAPVVEKDPYVAELLEILGTTKSVDAFLTTVSLLADVVPEGRKVIPAVIRNAERLGIYGRHVLDENAMEGMVAKQLTAQLMQMARGKAERVRGSDPAGAPAPRSR